MIEDLDTWQHLLKDGERITVTAKGPHLFAVMLADPDGEAAASRNVSRRMLTSHKGREAVLSGLRVALRRLRPTLPTKENDV